jgi:hypothetical protein
MHSFSPLPRVDVISPREPNMFSLPLLSVGVFIFTPSIRNRSDFLVIWGDCTPVKVTSKRVGEGRVNMITASSLSRSSVIVMGFGKR